MKNLKFDSFTFENYQPFDFYNELKQAKKEIKRLERKKPKNIVITDSIFNPNLEK